MGTIPGPTIEANVGDQIIVHFRNHDHRLTTKKQSMAIEHRCHSLHPHGVVFQPTSDGAYPLSPADSTQPVGAESALWAAVPGGGVTQFKKGDRVPPDATFTYTWETFGWPATAGVWLYHDHSICDDDNVNLGAIGIIVIHNTADTNQEVDPRDPANPSQLDPAFLPGGSPTGSPIFNLFVPLPTPTPLLPHQIDGVSDHPDAAPPEETPSGGGGGTGGRGGTGGGGGSMPMPMATASRSGSTRATGRTGAARATEPAQQTPMVFQHGDMMLGIDDKLHAITISTSRYRTPPTKLLILQLFHSLTGGPTCINGRQYLGNTPTIVSGPSTLMRFGVVGMGSEFHTFHLHGHRWILPGPDGITPNAIQSSAQVRAVSQFEDTRTFGPANSLVFTINEAPGSFMRAGGPSGPLALGEWHMHCHVLMHMMTGMMGSLFIINGGEVATTLPRGVPCPPADSAGPAPPGTTEVDIQNIAFNPKIANIKVGDTVHWVWKEDNHSVTADNNSFDSGVNNNGHTFDHMFMAAGTFNYYCKIHGAPGGVGMSGQVVVT